MFSQAIPCTRYHWRHEDRRYLAHPGYSFVRNNLSWFRKTTWSIIYVFLLDTFMFSFTLYLILFMKEHLALGTFSHPEGECHQKRVDFASPSLILSLSLFFSFCFCITNEHVLVTFSQPKNGVKPQLYFDYSKPFLGLIIRVDHL